MKHWFKTKILCFMPDETFPFFISIKFCEFKSSINPSIHFEKCRFGINLS